MRWGRGGIKKGLPRAHRGCFQYQCYPTQLYKTQQVNMCISQQSQFGTEGFCWIEDLLSTCPYCCNQIRKKMLQFSSMVLSIQYHFLYAIFMLFKEVQAVVRMRQITYVPP